MSKTYTPPNGEVLLDAAVSMSKFSWDNPPWSATIELGVGHEGTASGTDGGKLGDDLCYCFLRFKQNSEDPGQAASFMQAGKKYRLILLDEGAVPV